MSFSSLPNTGPLVALTQSGGTGPLNDSARFVGLSMPNGTDHPVDPDRIYWLPKRRNPWIVQIRAWLHDLNGQAPVSAS